MKVHHIIETVSHPGYRDWEENRFYVPNRGVIRLIKSGRFNLRIEFQDSEKAKAWAESIVKKGDRVYNYRVNYIGETELPDELVNDVISAGTTLNHAFKTLTDLIEGCKLKTTQPLPPQDSMDSAQL